MPWVNGPEVPEVTLTVTDFETLPPAPLHVRVYVVLAAGETLCVPDTAFAPVQPFDAVQEVAFVADQVSVEDWPLVIEAGDAVKVSAGVTGDVGETFTVTFLLTVAPEMPVHRRE